MKIAQKIYNNLESSIDHIVNNKEQYVVNPHRNFIRNRKLPLKCVIKEILSMEGGSLKKELYRFSQNKKIQLTPSAFVQQRSKISSKAFKDIFYRFNDCCRDSRTYRGYKLLAVDGTDINHYRNPNLDSFITSSQYPHGYNQIHLNAIYDILNKTYVNVLLQPRPKEHERNALIQMISEQSFRDKSIIIMDRGYEGYNTIAHLLRTPNLDFVCRVKHGTGAIKRIAELPMEPLDVDVEVEIATSQKNIDKARNRVILLQASKKGKINSPKTNLRRWDFESPYTLKFRVVRFLLDTGEYETIITSLTRKVFSIKEIKELYHMRWGIETSFRELKYAIGLINLHCKKEDLIIQEIYASLVVYNFFSRIAGNALIYKRKKTVYAYKVDFTMAIHICRTFYRKEHLNFKQLISDIGKYTEPIRPGRKDKRSVKPKRFIGFTYRVAA